MEANSGIGSPLWTLVMQCLAWRPKGRQVNGTVLTVISEPWDLQDGPHWVTGTLEKHILPGSCSVRCLRMVQRPVAALEALAGWTMTLEHISVSFLSSDMRWDGTEEETEEEEEADGIIQEATANSGLDMTHWEVAVWETSGFMKLPHRPPNLFFSSTDGMTSIFLPLVLTSSRLYLGALRMTTPSVVFSRLAIGWPETSLTMVGLPVVMPVTGLSLTRTLKLTGLITTVFFFR